MGKKIYATQILKACIGEPAIVGTAFGLVRTSAVDGMCGQSKSILMLTTANSEYEIIKLPEKKVRLADAIQFVSIGRPAFVSCDGLIMRTSNVVATMEDEYGYYVETINTIYALKGAAVQPISKTSI